jgi:hypothetical protein
MITKRRKGNKAQAKIPARNNIITTNIQIFSSRKLSHCVQYNLYFCIMTAPVSDE